MTNLTEISIGARKFGLYLLGGIGLIIILRILLTVIVNSIPKPLPKPVLPDVKFQKLPAPKFSDIERSSSGLHFSLENIEGKPPEATTVAKVYSMPKKSLTLLSSDKATAIAKKLNFQESPEIANQTSYFYKISDFPNKSLSIDIVYLNLEYRTVYEPYAADIFQKAILSTKEVMVANVINFITKNGLMDASFTNSAPIVQLLRFDDPTKKFVEVDKIKNAHAIRVNFFRQNLNGLRILPPKFNESYNYALYTQSPPYDFLEISSIFWPIDYANVATYPLKSSQQAWQDLLDGYGFVVKMGNNSPDKIIIRKIYLAYYDSKISQPYLQPIFVFEGDNNFTAYVPAITSEWLE